MIALLALLCVLGSTRRILCNLPSGLTAAEMAEYSVVYDMFMKTPPCKPRNGIIPYDCAARYRNLQADAEKFNVKSCSAYLKQFPADHYKIEFEFKTNECRIIALRDDDPTACSAETHGISEL